MLRDDPLGHLGDAADRGVGEVQARLLVLHEAGVEAALALMAGVGADHGEAARQSGTVAGGLAPSGARDRAVETAAALEQEPAVPVPGGASAKPMP